MSGNVDPLGSPNEGPSAMDSFLSSANDERFQLNRGNLDGSFFNSSPSFPQGNSLYTQTPQPKRLVNKTAIDSFLGNNSAFLGSSSINGDNFFSESNESKTNSLGLQNDSLFNFGTRSAPVENDSNRFQRPYSMNSLASNPSQVSNLSYQSQNEQDTFHDSILNPKLTQQQQQNTVFGGNQFASMDSTTLSHLHDNMFNSSVTSGFMNRPQSTPIYNGWETNSSGIDKNALLSSTTMNNNTNFHASLQNNMLLGSEIFRPKSVNEIHSPDSVLYNTRMNTSSGTNGMNNTNFRSNNINNNLNMDMIDNRLLAQLGGSSSLNMNNNLLGGSNNMNTIGNTGNSMFPPGLYKNNTMNNNNTSGMSASSFNTQFGLQNPHTQTASMMMSSPSPQLTNRSGSARLMSPAITSYGMDNSMNSMNNSNSNVVIGGPSIFTGNNARNSNNNNNSGNSYGRSYGQSPALPSPSPSHMNHGGSYNNNNNNNYHHQNTNNNNNNNNHGYHSHSNKNNNNNANTGSNSSHSSAMTSPSGNISNMTGPVYGPHNEVLVEETIVKTCRDILIEAANRTLKAVELANTLRARVGTEMLAYVREKWGGLLALLERHMYIFQVERIPKNDLVKLISNDLSTFLPSTFNGNTSLTITNSLLGINNNNNNSNTISSGNNNMNTMNMMQESVFHTQNNASYGAQNSSSSSGNNNNNAMLMPTPMSRLSSPAPRFEHGAIDPILHMPSQIQTQATFRRTPTPSLAHAHTQAQSVGGMMTTSSTTPGLPTSLPIETSGFGPTPVATTTTTTAAATMGPGYNKPINMNANTMTNTMNNVYGQTTTDPDSVNVLLHGTKTVNPTNTTATTTTATSVNMTGPTLMVPQPQHQSHSNHLYHHQQQQQQQGPQQHQLIHTPNDDVFLTHPDQQQADGSHSSSHNYGQTYYNENMSTTNQAHISGSTPNPMKFAPTPSPPLINGTPPLMSGTMTGGNLSSRNNPGIGGTNKEKENQPSRCLHIGNVPANLNENQLLTEFEQFGDVETLKVVTQRNRRFAFVTYKTLEQSIIAKQRMSKIQSWKSAISYAHKESYCTSNSTTPSPGLMNTGTTPPLPNNGQLNDYQYTQYRAMNISATTNSVGYNRSSNTTPAIPEGEQIVHPLPQKTPSPDMAFLSSTSTQSMNVSRMNNMSSSVTTTTTTTTTKELGESEVNDIRVDSEGILQELDKKDTSVQSADINITQSQSTRSTGIVDSIDPHENIVTTPTTTTTSSTSYSVADEMDVKNHGNNTFNTTEIKSELYSNYTQVDLNGESVFFKQHYSEESLSTNPTNIETNEGNTVILSQIPPNLSELTTNPSTDSNLNVTSPTSSIPSDKALMGITTVSSTSALPIDIPTPRQLPSQNQPLSSGPVYTYSTPTSNITTTTTTTSTTNMTTGDTYKSSHTMMNVPMPTAPNSVNLTLDVLSSLQNLQPPPPERLRRTASGESQSSMEYHNMIQRLKLQQQHLRNCPSPRSSPMISSESRKEYVIKDHVLKRLCDDTYVPTQIWPIDIHADAPYCAAVVSQLRQFGGQTTISKLRGFLRNRLQAPDNIKSVPLKAMLGAYPHMFSVKGNHACLVNPQLLMNLHHSNHSLHGNTGNSSMHMNPLSPSSATFINNRLSSPMSHVNAPGGGSMKPISRPASRDHFNLEDPHFGSNNSSMHGGGLSNHGGGFSNHGGSLSLHGGSLSMHGGSLSMHGVSTHGGGFSNHGGGFSNHGGNLSLHGSSGHPNTLSMNHHNNNISSIAEYGDYFNSSNSTANIDDTDSQLSSNLIMSLNMMNQNTNANNGNSTLGSNTMINNNSGLSDGLMDKASMDRLTQNLLASHSFQQLMNASSTNNGGNGSGNNNVNLQDYDAYSESSEVSSLHGMMFDKSSHSRNSMNTYMFNQLTEIMQSGFNPNNNNSGNTGVPNTGIPNIMNNPTLLRTGSITHTNEPMEDHDYSPGSVLSIHNATLSTPPPPGFSNNT